MRPRKMEISSGDKFGQLTVLKEVEHDQFGHMRYRVRCDCGYEYEIQRSQLFKDNPKCPDCTRILGRKQKAAALVGQTINNWHILFETGESENVQKFVCRCENCGVISVRTKSQMERVKTGRCENCPPEYNFRFDGTTAIGTLPDGSEFMIDREDVPRVSEKFWSLRKGYVVTDNDDPKHIKLQNFLIGEIPDEYIIDHINRNKLDNRKSNLRIATYQQNSMNRSIGKNNTSGYVGAFFHKGKGMYAAKISLGNRNIHLGYSRDLITCAQMYNIAAELLFGDYRGHVNDVPPPPDELVKKIKDKCRPYMWEAFEATQPCSLFLCTGTE